MSRSRLLILLFPLLLMLGAGPVQAANGQVSFEERSTVALQRAMEHYRAGKLNEAAGLLRGFLVSHKDSVLIDVAYLQLAKIHARLGQPHAALDYLSNISSEGRSADSRMLEGSLLIRTGDSIRGLDTLLSVDRHQLTLAEQQELLLVMADGAVDLGQPQRALYFLNLALFVEGQQSPTDVLAHARALMDERFDAPALAEAAFMYADAPIGSLAMLQLGWRAMEAGYKKTAAEWAAAVLAGPQGFAYREEALTLQAQVTDPSQVQRAIGVLLPLSGRYAAFGKHVQRGMELARQVYRPSVPVRFIYRDTAGGAEQADRQAAELILGEKVMAVAGPLVGSAASAAVDRVGRLQTPLLTMSQREGLTTSSLYVFRNSLTPRLQVRALVDHAIIEQELLAFGILHPETRQGELFADLFRREVERLGGTIIAEQGYASGQTDFRREVRLLLGLDPDAPDEEEEPELDENGNPVEKEEEPPPFQALFMPDYADQISLLAPQIEFYGLKDVQYLGTNGWNDPELLRTASKAVEGAIFADGFFRHSPYPFVQDFVERYFELYGEDPTILDAQGYDVAGILLNLLARRDVQSREDLRRELAQLQNYPGVTGATRFDFQGEAEKILFLLQVQNGTTVQIN